MDGTIYLDDRIFDGVTGFLKYVRNIGGKYVFMTNNSSKSVDKYIEKLNKIGIKSDCEDFLTSTDATILALKKKNYNKIYALGTRSFKNQLIGSGLPVTDELCGGIDCLCMGFDTELTFFVLSGEGTKADIEKYGIKPDYIYRDIKEMYMSLK